MMKIVTRNINDLKFADYNPRQLKQKQYEDLKNSLTTFGLVDPIIVNKHPEREDIIIGGHQRVRIAKDIGLKKVPTVELKLEEKLERELNVRLNKNVGEWDYDTLANNFEEGELIQWGFTNEELSFFEEDLITDGLIGDDEIPDIEDEEPPIQIGDVYQLGNHRLMCGDSTNPKHVAKLMNGNKADIIFTDPPYGVSYKGTEFDIIKNDDLRGNALYDLLFNAFKNGHTHTKENPAVYIFHASINAHVFHEALQQNGFKIKQQLIWAKQMILGRSDYHWAHEPIFYCIKDDNNCEWTGDRTSQTLYNKDKTDYDKLNKKELIEILLSLKDESTMWYIKKDNTQTYIHPTQKPVELCMKAIENNTHRKQILLDLFLGSGSSIIACEKTGRHCYGMEYDKKYAYTCIKRWEEFSGETAVKINTKTKTK